MKYDAFISYRHTPLDMEFAKKVHSGLETYHIPKAVQKKTGKKRINRVFRDQEELPIGSDLNDNISTALAESEYLIVICSPDTPGSYWVSKEIETFISLHDREHVLAVLVAGEPDQSFPPQLLTDSEGNAVEPLAADVRGNTPSERNKKFKTELLRLAAPVLGCTYDDLRQRHRERILKRNITVAASIAVVVAAAGTAFGFYNANVADRMRNLADEKAALAEDKSRLAQEKTVLADEKSKLADEKTQLADEILAEYRLKQINQSRFYAEKSLSLLNECDRRAAVLVALEALPSDDDERPFVPEAEYALSEALYAYDDQSKLAYERLLKHELTVKSTTLNSDSTRLCTTDSGMKTYVWDVESLKLLCKIDPEIGDDNRIVDVRSVDADEKNIYITNEKNFSVYDMNGTQTFKYEISGRFASAKILSESDLAILIGSKNIICLKLSDGSVLNNVEITDDYTYSGEYILSPDQKFLVAEQYNLLTDSSRFCIINLEDGSSQIVELTLPNIMEFSFTENGNIAIVSSNTDFYYTSLKALKLELFSTSGELKWSADVPITETRDFTDFRVLICTCKSVDKNLIAVSLSTELYAYDENTGSSVSSLTLSGKATVLYANAGSTNCFVAYKNGDVDAVNLLDGKVYTESRIATNVAINDMKVVEGQVFLEAYYSNSIFVMKYHGAPDISTYDYLPLSASGVGANNEADYYVLKNIGMKTSYMFFDNKRESLYTFDELENTPTSTAFYEKYFVCAGYSSLYLVDPVAKTAEEISYEDLGAKSNLSKSSFSANGRFVALWGMYDLYVVDIQDRKCLYSNRYDNQVGCAVIDNEGKTLLSSVTGKNLFLTDLSSGETKELKDDSLRALASSQIIKYLEISSDGKSALMACQDGKARLIALDSLSVKQEFPLSTQNKCFLGFADNDSKLVMQGDEYKVDFYETSGKLLNSINVEYLVIDACEDADGHIALCDSYSTYLVNNDSCGLVAHARHGAVYLPSEKTFVLVDGKYMAASAYKPYTELIKEAKKQFPDDTLSEDERTKYNIN